MDKPTHELTADEYIARFREKLLGLVADRWRREGVPVVRARFDEELHLVLDVVEPRGHG